MGAYAFFENRIVPLEEAKISVRTHAFNYGTACFEGIRGNWNPEKEELFLFRCREHYQRLLASCKVLKLELPHSLGKLEDITLELVEKCGYKEDIYIRPLAYKSALAIGPGLHGLESSFLIYVIPFGSYLNVDQGIRCCVSSWRRVLDNMIPPRAKLTGLYINSALAKTEAFENGFDEAILLTQDGHVSEGSGENIFLVMNGRLVTPPPYDSILLGITRSTIIQLAQEELGLEVQERSIARTELYTADECFLTGTAAHITPVLEVDHRPVGQGEIGPATKRLQSLYFDVVRGKVPKYRSWCTPAYSRVPKASR